MAVRFFLISFSSSYLISIILRNLIGMDDIDIDKLTLNYCGATSTIKELSFKFIDHLVYLWNCDEIQDAYKKYGYLHQCIDNLPYFMDKIFSFFSTCPLIDKDNPFWFDLSQCKAKNEDFVRIYKPTGWVNNESLIS